MWKTRTGPEPGIRIGGYSLAGIIRKLRRVADLSQRELAQHANVSPASIAGYETGAITPSLETLQRVLNAAHHQLVVVDTRGHLAVPLQVWQDVADGAGRRYPAHLDTILDPVFGDWWADGFGLQRPPETFRRNRAYRDWQRQQSQWDVRVNKYRFDPPPRKPSGPPGWEWDPTFDPARGSRRPSAGQPLACDSFGPGPYQSESSGPAPADETPHPPP